MSNLVSAEKANLLMISQIDVKMNKLKVNWKK